MVKLGFVKYDSTNNETIVSVKTSESTPTKGKSSFPFIASGNLIRDYVKRKLFKATKEEMSSLLKSTSNLNLASVFSSKSSSAQKEAKSKKCKKDEPSTLSEKEPEQFESENKWKPNADGQYYQQIDEESIRQTESTLPSEGPAIINIDSSTEIDEPVVEIKTTSYRRLSLIQMSKRKKKKTRFAQDLTQSLPAATSSSSSVQPPISIDPKSQLKIVTWAKKMRKCKVSKKNLSDVKVETGKPDGPNEEETKVPVKWTKKVRKFAIRTCRYLGYGAQMISPMTPYNDIPMPVTYDGIYNVYPPYYGSDRYYSYSSCGSVYGYKMGHYGLTY
ncbi:uncharacterized protein LOC128395001 [Panonychus citri]|uniref:uncharacterized protein LOC128395001 n=1 Tax=Panonychus citri TaxID=50023 RepID=UPI002306FEE7|nr:uncharacterized protein LOC128395001 [Panonychus citri]